MKSKMKFAIFIGIGALVTSASGAGAGVALAGAPSPVVKACVSKSTGATRIGKPCKKSEKKISWNERGEPGLADMVYHRAARVGVASKSSKVIQIACPAGKQAINGLMSSDGIISVSFSDIAAGTKGTRWVFRVDNSGAGEVQVYPGVICVSVRGVTVEEVEF